MKNFNYLLLILLLLNGNLFSQIKYESLKPGDWFDCEMEFENGMPVFRNHWIPDEIIKRDNQLLSIRFTFKGKDTSATYKWNYKVLRYRSIWNINNTKSGHQNLQISDSWYPSYFFEEFDSIRNSLTGSITIAKNGLINHNYKYDTNRYFYLRDVLITRSDSQRYIASYSQGKGALTKIIEETAGLIFQTHSLKGSTHAHKWKWFDQIKHISDKEIHFTIHENGSNNDKKSSCKAWILSNGLTYAFSDNHKQKVFAIYNASFPLPNKAVLNIIDKRKAKNIDDNDFIDLIWLIPDNPAFVINETGTPQLMELVSGQATKSFNLKCGTAFSFEAGTGQKAKLFIEPGDTINLIIKEGQASHVEILENINNRWWQDNLYTNLRIVNIEQTPVSPEFKSYLKLKIEATKISSKFRHEPTDFNYFNKSILKLYYLKSYHYGHYLGIGSSGFMHDRTLIRRFLKRYPPSELKFNFLNNYYSSGLKFKYYYIITNLNNFPLYFELFDILKQQLSRLQIGKDNQSLPEFISQCGDTLLRKDLENKIQGRKSIEKGKILPFKTPLTENNHEINILPSKGKYGLLFLYFYDKRNEFKNLIDSLPTNIQTVSYRLNNNGNKQSKNIHNVTSLNKDKNLRLFAHPSVNSYLKDIILTRYTPIIILYNDKGKILYSSKIGKQIGEENYLKRYRTKITNAIKNEQETKNRQILQIVFIVGISIFASLLIAFLFYQYKNKKTKKRNEQEKLIQQLKLKSIQSQLNPHFLFNALNSIQNLINSNNTQQANKYLIGFSNLLRGVLKNADKPLVPLTDELNLIERYCELEKLRVNFGCEIVENTETPTEIIEIPYMLLQPIIENAIKHGIAKMGEKGQLRIEISEADSFLYIRIIDNGQGFGDNNLAQLTLKGKGLKITIDKLKSIYNGDAKLTISNNTVQSGGVVQIKLKIG